jgi:hypothetical protein
VDSGERGKDEGFVIYLRMSRRVLMEFLGASVQGLDWAIRIVLLLPSAYPTIDCFSLLV